MTEETETKQNIDEKKEEKAKNDKVKDDIKEKKTKETKESKKETKSKKKKKSPVQEVDELLASNKKFSMDGAPSFMNPTDKEDVPDFVKF